MTSFSIYFLFCNLLISIIIGAVLLVKKISGKFLSGCCQYRLWFFLPILLALPFLSIRPARISRRILLLLSSIRSGLSPVQDAFVPPASVNPISSADWIHDFSISVTRTSIPAVGYLPFVLWITGMLAMAFYLIRSRIRLYHLEQSALPLQSQDVHRIYENCRSQMQIRRRIPVYSTAFLNSPIMVGTFRPRIYLPIHLILDHKENDIRYMLLHELQHYRHKDAFVNCLINLAAILYWFNPVVWYALKEIRTDREIACDTCVLQMLEPGERLDYGNTLLNFAQELSLSPFSLAAELGGNTRQIRKRIRNIASWQPLTGWHRIREWLVLTTIIALIWESTSWIPVSASVAKASLPRDAAIETVDLSDFFARQEGCFVLYDMGMDTWHIYNEALAIKRVAPDSTYKIYSALFALEHGTIAPDASSLRWDGQYWPFSQWNQDQTLTSAMQDSVNWYFQELDQGADFEELKEYYQSIDYGNHDLSGGVTDFWMESSLKISAIEQVELLKKFYTNEFHFEARNIQAVKDALKLFESDDTILSGKTGTGIVNGKSINGWFIGYVEFSHNTCFFAVNIQGTDHADGQTAGEIMRRIMEEYFTYPNG